MEASSSLTSREPPFRISRNDQMVNGAPCQPPQAREMANSHLSDSLNNSSIQMSWQRIAPQLTPILARVFLISEIAALNLTPTYRNSSRDCHRIFTIRGRGPFQSIPTTMELALTMVMRVMMTHSETIQILESHN